ncbi:LOW QUALITY PROTEIN: hypothetical protein NC651_027126 [Populus alba x Populus x berolinensis]|nr:LOW QUALITY PROTEIN: hypothetical protein NC651_027126 [Populus alba x Populus x berolinensis]
MQTGHVIADLGCRMLYGTLHSNSTLFSLHHLQKLDLSGNDFNGFVISSSFGQFLHLTHLNLYSSNFAGQVPPEISHLSRLVSLGLSSNSGELMLEPISFNKLAQNLTQLRELYFDGVNMSLVVPSSLMNLSSSLSSLQLWDCGLKGELPDNFFRRSNLQSLKLWLNEELTGSFSPYNLSNALSHLDLSYTRISIHLEPDSISHLKSVENMYLNGCNFVGSNLGLLGNLTQLIKLGLADNQLGGQIPFSLGKLKQLEYLDLGNNSFTGSIHDVFANQTQLARLDLSHNNFQGHLSFSLRNLKQLSSLLLSSNNFTSKILNEFSNLTLIAWLDLSNNKFDGRIPSSLGNLKKLYFLTLSFNNFSSKIPDSFFNLTQLAILDLSNNKFDGQISSFLENLKKLYYLTLSFNNFSGKIPDGFFNLTQLTLLDLSKQQILSFGNLKKLYYLSLSFNNFSGKIPDDFFNLTQLAELYLSNNKFDGQIPDGFANLTQLYLLDLSNNKFDSQIPDGFFNPTQLTLLYLSNNILIGSIPSQISRLSGLNYLDLSHNLLNGTIPSSLFSMPSLRALLLGNNLLYGQISPFLCNSLQYIDFSHNRLYGQIPPSVFKLEHLRALMLSSNNKLTGNISSVICVLKFLEILDLSNNGFSGFIPQCLGNFSDGLSVLHLGANNLHGNIPSIYSKENSLSYLNFNGNQLKGVIPPSIINCVNLEFLDLGNNMIDDTFPSFLETLPQLEVVVLRSNKLHGSLKGPTVKDSFSKLQIFDLSNNSLSGPLPTEYFNNFKAMMSVDEDMDYMRTHNVSTSYVYSVTLAWKGSEIEIPPQLVDLTFLQVLNLSYNHLEGPIPQGKQFNTFENGSYEGNLGLCGFPLQVKCNKGEGQQSPPSNFKTEDSLFGFGWKAVAMGYGCGFVFGVSMGYIVFRARKPAWFVKMTVHIKMQKGLEARMLPEMVEDDTSYSGRCEKVNNGSDQEEGIIFQASVYVIVS